MNSEQRNFHLKDLDKDLATSDSKLIDKIKEVISSKGKMEIRISDNFADIQVFPPDGVFEPQIIHYDMDLTRKVESMIESFSHFGNKAIKQASEFFGYEVQYSFLRDIFILADEIKQGENYEDQVLDTLTHRKDRSSIKRLRTAIKRLYIKSQKLSLVSDDNSKKIQIDADKLINSDLAIFNEELLIQLSETLLKLGNMAFQIRNLTKNKIDPYILYDEKNNSFESSLDEESIVVLEKVAMVQTESIAENEFLEILERMIPLLTKYIKSSPFRIDENRISTVFRDIFKCKLIDRNNSVPDDINPYFFERWRAFFKRKAQKGGS